MESNTNIENEAPVSLEQTIIQSKKSITKYVILGVVVALILVGDYFLFRKINTNKVDVSDNADNVQNQNNLSNVSKELNTVILGGKKELYYMNINESGVKTDLFVNGILAYSGNMPSNWDEPITKYMKNGDNKIEINVTKVAKDPNNISCSFGYGYIPDIDVSKDIVYSDKKFVCGDSLKNNGSESFNFIVKTNLPFDLPWEKGKKFENNEITKDMLLVQYKEMKSILSSLDEDKIKSFLKYKIERNSNWMYETKDEAEKEYIKNVKLTIGGEKVEATDVLSLKDNLFLVISKDGLLAKLVYFEIDVKTGEKNEWDPLMWYDKKDDTVTSYPVWFMMAQDGQIIPIL